MWHDHSVANFESIERTASVHDFTNDFMAKHRTWRCQSIAQFVQVGAAKAYHPQGQQELTWPRAGGGTNFDGGGSATLAGNDSVGIAHGVGRYRAEAG